MAFTFSTSEEASLLIVKINGERPVVESETVEQLWGFFDKAMTACRAKGLTRMVVLSGAAGRASSSAVLAFYGRLEFFGLDRRMRIAVVIEDDAARRVTQLGVAVAKGNGWDIALFGTEQEARAWIV